MLVVCDTEQGRPSFEAAACELPMLTAILERALAGPLTSPVASPPVMGTGARELGLARKAGAGVTTVPAGYSGVSGGSVAPFPPMPSSTRPRFGEYIPEVLGVVPQTAPRHLHHVAQQPALPHPLKQHALV